MIDISDSRSYIESFLSIRTKEGEIIPFRLNEPQRRLMDAIEKQRREGRPVRIIILKARQMGFSTLTEGIIFHSTATQENTEAMIVAHTDEATGNLFRMSKRFYEYLPDLLKPMTRASNAQEIVFDKPSKSRVQTRGLGSRIRCTTAGGHGIGRSYTLKCLHLSEYAFWPGDKNETYSGIAQAVPDLPGTMIIIESTANGYDDFKDKWDAAVKAHQNGEDGYFPIFFPWYEMPEYRRAVPPGFTLTPEETKIKDTFRLSDEQMAWRRWCIAANCGGDLNKFRQEYPATPDEAFISTGECVFDKDAIVLRRRDVEELPKENGIFTIRKDALGAVSEYCFSEEKGGPIRVFERPKKGVPYVIGGDTAGTGSDFFAAQVIDNTNGRQVAVLHHRLGERFFAEQLYCLGMWYNTALIGVEINYSTYPEMILEELKYPKLYVREYYDTYEASYKKAFGFDTTPLTRPLMIDNLKDAAKSDIGAFCDYETLGEMLTFVYNKNWRPEAEVGKHDDLVMSLAIAHLIRSQQRATPEQESGSRWTKDMREDYEHADANERARLRKKWGNPK